MTAWRSTRERARVSTAAHAAALMALLLGLAMLSTLDGAWAAPTSAGDPGRGAAGFRECAACHSVEPGRHLTGPSLAGVYGRRAGSAEGFGRYSDALRQSGVTWDEKALDAWLANPAAFIPGNAMTFPGITDAGHRADLIGYLETVSQGGQGVPAPRGGMRGGGMMGGGERPNLKEAGKDQQVTAIRYCGDGYRVTTAGGQTRTFWEFNLRFKTDSSPDGPAKGKPVLLPAGMMGDRASIVFAGPDEIGTMIERRC
jgi:cytochrome c